MLLGNSQDACTWSQEEHQQRHCINFLLGFASFCKHELKHQIRAVGECCLHKDKPYHELNQLCYLLSLRHQRVKNNDNITSKHITIYQSSSFACWASGQSTVLLKKAYNAKRHFPIQLSFQTKMIFNCSNQWVIHEHTMM